MDEDPTEDTIKKEIQAAVKILREDGFHIHRTYSKFKDTLTGDKEDGKPNKKDGPADPPPPKPQDPPTEPTTKKKGVWWGDRE